MKGKNERGRKKKMERGKKERENKRREKKFHSRARTCDLSLYSPATACMHERTKPTYIVNLDCHELRVASLALPIIRSQKLEGDVPPNLKLWERTVWVIIACHVIGRYLGFTPHTCLT